MHVADGILAFAESDNCADDVNGGESVVKLAHGAVESPKEPKECDQRDENEKFHDALHRK